jgi:hypothetical protein
MRVVGLVVAGVCLLEASENLWAQSFGGGTNNSITWGPGPATDTEYSAGQFTLVVNPAYASYLAGALPPQLYNASTNQLTSGFLFDPATSIARSAATTVGSTNYVSGLPVGSAAGPIVSNGSIAAYPTGYTPPLGSDMAFTQIASMDLSGQLGATGAVIVPAAGVVGGGPSIMVTAGAAANDPNLPASNGEVVSVAGMGGSSGTAANDFPARSFFDVFVDVTLPLGPGGSNQVFTNATVGSTTGDPLIIMNSGITSFPPVVVYTHSGNGTAVPILFQTDDTAVFGPTATAGAVFGILTLAGHGQGYGGDPPVDENTGLPATEANFEAMYSQLTPLPVAAGSPYVGWGGTDPVTVLPEPSTVSLLVIAGLAAAALRLRRRCRIA